MTTFSFDVKTQIEGGSNFEWDDLDVHVTKVYTGFDDYGGKRPDLKEAAVFVVAEVNRGDDGIKTETRTFRVGKASKLTPSKDGSTPSGDTGTTFCGAAGLSASSNAGYFVASLDAVGVDSAKLDDLSKLAGSWFHCKRKSRPQIKDKVTGELGKETFYTVVTKKLDKPAWTPSASAGSNGSSAVSAAAVKATIKVIKSILSNNEDGVTIAKLRSKVFDAIDDDDDLKPETNLLIADADWMKSSERPWTIKQSLVTLND